LTAEVRVAVAVICRGEQCLIAKRPNNVHQGGLWEFPGGKCEAGETVEQALHRELQEEVGICITHANEIMSISHAYPDKKVCLEICEVIEFSGEPRGCEGQEIRWVSVSDLASYDFPEANSPIIDFLLKK